MKTQIECFPCLVNQAINSSQLVGLDESDSREIVNRTLELLISFDSNQSAPLMAGEIHRMIREKTGSSDPYREIKSESNRVALALESTMRRSINRSKDPLSMAINYAIAGNIIDFGAKSNVSTDDIKKSLDRAKKNRVDSLVVEELRVDLKKARKVLILGDNAGEIVMDKLLIEQLDTAAEIIYVVKGSPVINDVTMEDGEEVGMDRVAELIDNGSSFPGTILSDCSSQFIEHFNSADIVIAKGQGNFESLSETDREIYFLFQVKCPPIAKITGCKIKDFVIKKSKI